jgi:hypothetical protein
MYKFLFVVDISYPAGSTFGTNVSSEWNSFEVRVQKELPPSIWKSRTSRNVWLLDCENALPDLLALSGLAESCGMAYTASLISGDIVSLAKPIKITKASKS